jgi:hypothetical protein
MQQIMDIVASLPNLAGAVGIFLCIIAYLVLLLLVRWKLIAKPVRASLRSRIEQVQTVLPDEPPMTTRAGELLDKANELVNESGNYGYFFWSQGKNWRPGR